MTSEKTSLNTPTDTRDENEKQFPDGYQPGYRRICAEGLVDRPHYGYCSYHAAALADELGKDRVSLLELGVATGNGLLSLEKHAQRIEDELDVSVETYGFDLGAGLPEPQDYRDLPYTWEAGDYDMDESRLLEALDRSDLWIGDVAETIPEFVDSRHQAPVGAMFVDLDYYSSTSTALEELFDLPDSLILPRVPMYFDDSALGFLTQHIPQIGATRAIEEFNNDRTNEAIGKIQFSSSQRTNTNIRPERLYSYHRFDHGEYETHIGPRDKQIPFGNR